MSTPATDYFLDPGIDPTGTFGPYASVLLQMITLAIPNSYHGATLYSETAPPTTGQPTGYPTDWYAWHKRCNWVKPSTGEEFVYKTGLGWQTPALADDSLDGDVIADGTLDISKLAIGTGAAKQIIRINAGATAYEFVNIENAFTANTLSPSVLSGSAAGKFLGYSGGGPAWVTIDAAFIIAAIADGSLAITKLTPGTAKYVARTNAAGTAVEWAAIGTIIENGSLSLAKLASASGSDVGKVLTVQGDGSWAQQAVPTLSKTAYTGGPTAIPAFSATPTLTQYTHGLAGIPQIVRPVWVCTSNDGGYLTNEEVDFGCLFLESANGDVVLKASVASVLVDANHINVQWTAYAGLWNNPVALYATSLASGFVALDRTKWSIKVYTTYLA